VEGHTWVFETDRWQRCIYYHLDDLEVIGNIYEKEKEEEAEEEEEDDHDYDYYDEYNYDGREDDDE
jgi:hypothetical protein